MLQLRNTPDADCKLSPAQILFGHPLRDAFGFVNRCPKFENPEIQSIWRKSWACKEDALRARFAKSVEKSNENAHTLSNLEIGERVFLQNQSGKHPNKWDRSGVVIESLGHDQYNVKVDGTGRVTPRNRRFLRRYTLDENPPALFNDGISMSGECAPPDQSRIPLYRHCQLPEMPTELSRVPEESLQSAEAVDIDTVAVAPVSQDDPVAMTQQPVVEDVAAAEPPQARRSTRIKTQTKRYDADSGTWI